MNEQKFTTTLEFEDGALFYLMYIEDEGGYRERGVYRDLQTGETIWRFLDEMNTDKNIGE